MVKKKNKQKEQGNQDINNFRDTRLCVIDEISFASYETVLGKLSHNLKGFTECYEHLYGKHAIAFLGDFCQLEPIGGDPIYMREDGTYWEQALNCMVELEGTHRFEKCETYKKIMPSLRTHGLSDEDRETLNSRVVGSIVDGKEVKLPTDRIIPHATYTNAKKSEINANVFESYLSVHHKNATQTDIPFSAIVIKADAVWVESKKRLSFDQRKTLFEECSEADCKESSKNDSNRMDPFLCLHYNCELMGTENEAVDKGKAKGTTAHLKKVWLKPGAKLEPMRIKGYWVHTVSARDVDHLELRYHSMRRFEGNFKVDATKTKTCRVNFPVTIMDQRIVLRGAPIKITQFPVTLNHATTGHKLQGKSLDELVIAEWRFGVRNWAYVVLSRVRTLEGLYLLQPIPDDVDFKPHPAYIKMMERLRSTILATPEQVKELKHEIRHTIDQIRKEMKENNEN